MNRQLGRYAVGALAAAIANVAAAGTDTYFNPLTQSAVVSSADSFVERNHPWLAPPGLTQENLTSLSEAESAIGQSMVRVPGLGAGASNIDMSAFSPDGRYVFLPHETQVGAGLSRYDVKNREVEILFRGDTKGTNGDWSSDYGAFDPATWTPDNTVLVAEEWSGEGRVIEVVNPLAPAASIQIRELHGIPNVSHEGLRFSDDGRVLYFVDENNSGSLYKIIFRNKNDYSKGGQVFVLKVDAYDGQYAGDNYNASGNSGQPRTGLARWIPMTNQFGNAVTTTDPFSVGGGRPAADELGATPYGRPEDMEVGRLANGREVIYFAATSEQSVYSVEELRGSSGDKARVRLAASNDSTPKNLGFDPTSAVLNSPDNLAQDALGNIYIIEDAPNGNATGGDIWFLRDVDTDGVAESIDHFLSLQVNGSEATGMIFNPARPTEFIVSVQHPSSTDLDANPEGFGDALWKFDLSDVVPPPCERKSRRYWFGSATCTNTGDFHFIKLLERANKPWWRWW